MQKSNRSGSLAASSLTYQPAVERLPFRESHELEPFHGVLGHARALQAIDFGLSIDRAGYNLFVSGFPGSGRLTLTTDRVRDKAKGVPAADDSLYLPNFFDGKIPVALKLPAGLGKKLLEEIESAVDSLASRFSSSMESPGYQREKATIDKEFADRYGSLLDELTDEARELGVYLVKEGESISFAPLLGDEPATEVEFSSFPEEEREAFHQHVQTLEGSVVERFMDVPHWRRESREKLLQFNKAFVSEIVTPLMSPIMESFKEFPGLTTYFRDMSSHVTQLLMDELGLESSDDATRKTKLLKDCLPRLLVTNIAESGRPVIVETHPTLRNLFGYVETMTEQGTMVTRHNLIFPGSVHRANGGYLIMEAEKLVAEPQVWPALKRALKNGGVRIEGAVQDLNPTMSISLNPQEMPLQLKVVLVGSADLFYVLQDLDSEFIELFRILCDFDEDLLRDTDNELLLLRLLQSLGVKAGLPSFTSEAASVLIREACRMADHQDRFSLHIAELMELLVEADHHRKLNGNGVINREDIERTLDERKHRYSKLSEQVLQEILDGSILIDTHGVALGRVNGLTVIEIGNFQFGNPARISATIFPGSRGIVDIEREVELGEAIHSKGVMILAGYLGQRYARNLRMAFSANLVLEQSYGHVDGDSASLAELCALISALTEIPLKQSIAVTGSINQHGDVQPVGGINEKIEGFFQLCLARGLSGKQGVIIPQANERHLMLDNSVVEAVAAKKFNIWIVSTVDQTLRLLTGKSSQHIDRRVMDRLKALADLSEHSDI